MSTIPDFQPLVDAAAFYVRMRGVTEIAAAPFAVIVSCGAIYAAWRLLCAIGAANRNAPKKAAAKKSDPAP